MSLEPIKIHILRHLPVREGVVYGKNVDFNEMGLLAFLPCAEKLPVLDNSVWFSSDYPRAMYTAYMLLLLKRRSFEKPKLRLLPSVREHCLNAFEGQKWEDLRADPQLQGWFENHWAMRPVFNGIENGETSNEFIERTKIGIDVVIDSLARDPLGKREAVVVAHKGTIQAAAYLAGLTNRDTYLKYDPDYLEVLTLTI
jgi:broad specificity phosphatase PhoE